MTFPMSSPSPPTSPDVQAYYDEFSDRYERYRGKGDPGGYHALVDDLEVDFAVRYGAGGDVLEVGCGTGLILERLVPIARRVEGIDLSARMLDRARARGLSVRQGSVLELPYPDATFDVTCSFKVLPHVEGIQRALAEMARVTRPRGVVIAEFYNPMSLRGLVKRFGPPGAISDRTTERSVFTRFDLPWKVKHLLPPGFRIVDSRGVRIVTPAAMAMRIPVLRGMLRAAEWTLADSWLSVFGGFWIGAIARGG
jgi:ubiquinone/menaquinone biosynthesis C-methylase UbiE